jgi:hypothetical protein
MTVFIQHTNPNGFTPRYRKYKQLRSDIWGYLAYANKKNDFYKIMRRYAEVQLRKRIRVFKTKKKRYFQRLFRMNKPRFRFEYSVKARREPELKKPLNFRSSLRVLRKKLVMFYNFRLRGKPLRKLFSKANRFVQRRTIFKQGNRYLDPVLSHKNDLEARIDVLLYRLNFIQTVYEGRRFIQGKLAFILKPSTDSGKFFHYYTAKKYFHKVPLFHFISLRYDLAIILKYKLINMILANKLLSYPPDYLMVDYRTMIGLRHIPAIPIRVRYPFQGTLAYFIGLAMYY